MLSIRDKVANLDVIIEPLDPAIQKVVQKIKAKKHDFFANVEKIIVHSGGGFGQLGHVEMGPNKDPHEIHIFKDRIIQIVKKQFKNPDDPQALQDAIEMALIEVIGHEQTHIGKEKDVVHFKSEPEAELGGRKLVQEIGALHANDAILNASLVLDEIRLKYFPNHSMPEPSLSFMIRVAHKDTKRIVKEAIELIKNEEFAPAYFDIVDAVDFNTKVSTLQDVIKALPVIISKVGVADYKSEDFVTSLASLQAWMGLEPTGKLDKTTISKFPPATENIPRNFGVVVPGKIYRGGLIEEKSQLKTLKDIFGVKRVIALHEYPEEEKMCLELGIEFVPKYMDSEDSGKDVFDSVTDILDEKPVYVHCLYGQDRTGAVIARYRTENGWSSKLAYSEAKAYGFQDKFPDMIDWFCEPAEDDPPISTKKIRRLLSKEQDCLEATPTDMPFSNPFNPIQSGNYLTWTDTINNITPSMSLTTPILGPETA
jgi:hypothetical protein